MFENKTFSFVKHFKLFLIISAILVVTGVAGLVTLPFGVNLFNMDVDFLGGVTMTYDLGQQADTAEVENIAKGVLEGKLSSVTTSGSTGTQVVVKALYVPNETRDALYDAIAAEYPDEESGIQVESLDVVSVQDGVEKGYIVGSNFYKAGDEKTEVSAVDITKQKKLYVVCVTGSAKLQTDGAIQYVSEGVTLNGNTAETPEGETSYIIFR